MSLILERKNQPNETAVFAGGLAMVTADRSAK
jgi:hypothetical protein